MSKFFILLFFASFCSKMTAQKNNNFDVNIKVDFCSFNNVEYGTVKIEYQNLSNDALYLWIQNWNISVLKKNDTIPKKPYSTGALANFFMFYDLDSLPIPGGASDFTLFDTTQCYRYIKKMTKDEVFTVHVITKDSSFIEFLKNAKNKACKFVYTVSSKPSMKDLDSDPYSVLSYNKNDLYLYTNCFNFTTNRENSKNIKTNSCADNGELVLKAKLSSFEIRRGIVFFDK